MLRAGLTAKLPECSSNDPKRSRLPKIDLPVWTEAHLRAATNGVDRSLCIGGTRAPVFLGSVGHRLFAIKVRGWEGGVEGGGRV